MCVAGKNLNSNQFVEVLLHLSFLITICSHLYIRDLKCKYVRGGRYHTSYCYIKKIQSTVAEVVQWPHLMELFEKTFLCIGSCPLDKNMAEHNQPISKKVDF